MTEAAAPASSPRRGLAGSYLITVLASGGMLVFNLYTGVVSARLLAPEGRGVAGAIAGWVLVVAFVSGLGFREGMSWVESRDRRRAPQVLTTTVVSVVLLSVAGIGITQLVLPWGFSAQSDEALYYARVAMLWVLPFVAFSSFGSLFGARQQFVAVNVMRTGQPFLYAVALTVMWAVGDVGVADVLIAQAMSFLLPAVVAFLVLERGSGLGRLDRAVAREGATYGFKAFGSTLGQIANSRLDLVVLPAIVVASEIGLYVVAVSAATMVVGLFGSLQFVVFPAAARAGGNDAVAISQRAIRLVLFSSVLVALALGVLAPLFVRVLYGVDFIESVVPLRILLPGVCCWAAATIVAAGLKAIGRPFAATIAQLVGVVATLVGLAILLRPYGIIGAAITSTVSYGIVFVVGLFLFMRATGTTALETFGPSGVRSDAAWLRGRLQQRRLGSG